MIKNKISEKIRKNWDNHENIPLEEQAQLPNTIMLELTNACNLSCTMCMNPKMTRKKGYMDLTLIEKILQEAYELNIKNIALYTTGESLLHPKIFEIIDLCKKYDRYVYLTTNALLLNDTKIHKLLESNIDSIKYSIDGLKKEEYESIRIGGSYDKVIENLKSLKSKRDTLNYKTKLSMGIILTSQNIEQKELYIKQYKDYVDEIVFSLISNQTGHISNKEYKSLQPKNITIDTIWKPCRQLWDRIVVTYDGELTTCCIDFEAALTYADLRTVSLKDAWNNLKMQQYRNEHISHNFKSMDLCKKCDSPYIQQSSIFESLNGNK